MSLTNVQVSELLALRAAELTGDRQRAYRRASSRALHWPDEVADMVEQGRQLTELRGIGTRLSGLIRSWLEDPPEVPNPPPTRAGFSSFAAARKETSGPHGFSVRADLQMHTVGSDGHASVEEMARGAIELGYEYIAVTDHTKGLKIAGGMDETEFARQRREIDAVNEKLSSEGQSFRVLQGMEMNLGLDGAGDMEQSALKDADLVLGSFHSKLRLKDDQTDRYIAALRNPDIHVLGHPRGRMYNFRSGLTADWPKVFAVAADEGKALECDCFPHRQDLNAELLAIARDAGTWISMGTDAHNELEMMFMPLGIAAALRAGIDRGRIINLMSADELVEWAANPDLRRS